MYHLNRVPDENGSSNQLDEKQDHEQTPSYRENAKISGSKGFLSKTTTILLCRSRKPLWKMDLKTGENDREIKSEICRERR
ncbi:hypothetical protein AMTR_s00088p00091390 [Amborella trichopoda]|uniref:Uncharacterized protein n=1 Tax=Amborella trichopoda TaxID=13333 RepID=W1NXW8_AMBTC|nr:hypothetical protein AMTR_s00088p00091390 [Amborella trichopoda]